MSRFALLVCLLAVSGCATIVEGTSQNVAVVTEPAGATCTMDRQAKLVATIDRTPGAAHLDKSSNDLLITCNKDGFKPVTVTDSAHLVGTTLGNVVAGGLVGFVVDAASGADNAYQPEVHLGLDPATQAATAGAASQQIPCPEGIQASRSNGTIVVFKGRDPTDPDICLQQIQQQIQRLYFAVAPVDGPDAAARYAALKAVFTGQPGTTGDYESQNESGHWTHELRMAEPEIMLVDHRIIRADRLVDHRRNVSTQVEGDATLWIDPTNGMPLKLSWHQTTGAPIADGKAVVAEWNTVSLTLTTTKGGTDEARLR
jgi:hypothetical protein